MKKKSQSFHTTIRLLFILRGRMFVWTCDQVRHVLWKEADNTFTPQSTRNSTAVSGTTCTLIIREKVLSVHFK